MKQKGILLVITFAAALQITACGKESGTVTAVANPTEEMSVMDTIKSLAELETSVQVENTTKGTEQEEAQVRIYYGNRKGSGLQMEEVTLSELTADRLVAALGTKNIVSIDTKVQEFSEQEGEGGKTLYLDLSKHFKEYLKMMGSDGETIVIQSLVNTFLDNYGADQMILTVNGVPLETGFRHYTEPLTMFLEEEGTQEDKSQENPSNCRITEEKVQTEQVDISYPQFTDMQDASMMKKWNTAIRERALGNYDEKNMKSYQLGYEVTTQNAGVISILFKGTFYAEGAVAPGAFAYSYNFDFTTGNNLRLVDYGDMDKISKALKEGTGYEVLSEDVPKEEVTAYVTGEYTGEKAELFQDFDYDLNNGNMIPMGYSYMTDDHVVLILLVPHALGDYVELVIL